MASSYHLPHRGLPQELLDKIYAYALRPNEGLTIRCKGENQPYNSPQPEQDPNERAQCYIQGLAAGLLRTNWKTYCDTKHMLYSNTCVTIATRSIDAIDFIVELPLQIRSVIIPAEITLMCSPRAWIDDLDTYEDWSYYLKKKMPSAEVTIVVKDARARRSGDSPTDCAGYPTSARRERGEESARSGGFGCRVEPLCNTLNDRLKCIIKDGLKTKLIDVLSEPTEAFKRRSLFIDRWHTKLVVGSPDLRPGWRSMIRASQASPPHLRRVPSGARHGGVVQLGQRAPMATTESVLRLY
ncbi:hypothetical protein BU16DRAFT_536564 [Lophium mytilinum]|uniref:Uncharacterized protein n=1 Tax=Lophium mytilinum TaxID=390894 RepID=A0A6A6R2P0_9PEZI|nr:hypothetical protein BU16DRAFT_536564 [Lophium mytilinum]